MGHQLMCWSCHFSGWINGSGCWPALIQCQVSLFSNLKPIGSKWICPNPLYITQAPYILLKSHSFFPMWDLLSNTFILLSLAFLRRLSQKVASHSTIELLLIVLLQKNTKASLNTLWKTERFWKQSRHSPCIYRVSQLSLWQAPCPSRDHHH